MLYYINCDVSKVASLAQICRGLQQKRLCLAYLWCTLLEDSNVVSNFDVA